MPHRRFFDLYPLSGPGGLAQLRLNVVSSMQPRIRETAHKFPSLQPRDIPGFCNCESICLGQERLLKSGAQYVKHMIQEAHRLLLLDPVYNPTDRETSFDNLDPPRLAQPAFYQALSIAELNEIQWRESSDYVLVWSSPPPSDIPQTSVFDFHNEETSNHLDPATIVSFTSRTPTPSALPMISGVLQAEPGYHALLPPLPIYHPLLHDFWDQWPFEVANTIANPAAILPNDFGFESGPYVGSPPNFVELYLAIQAATLTALHVPRSIAVFILKSAIQFTRLIVEKCQELGSDHTILRIDIPSTSSSESQSLTETASLTKELVGNCRVSMESVDKRLGLNVPLICHAVCPNEDCQEVFHQYLTKEAARQKLNTHCSACGTELREDGKEGKQLKCKWFPRIPLKYELERILAHAGVEEACFSWKTRRDTQPSFDNLPNGIKLYQEQYDGSYWNSVLGPTGKNISQEDKGDVIYVNFSIDWFNANHGIHQKKYSLGPIVLEIANLPPELRPRQPLLACVGITPGPGEPRAANLWKFTLPLFMELRQAWKDFIYLRTPSAPGGRPVRILLCAVVCDRPAAINAIGAASQSSPDAICTRCDATTADLLTSKSKSLAINVKIRLTLTHEL